MKITLAQLSLELKKKLSALYVISGDEPLLHQDALTAIRTKAYEAGFDEHIRLTPDDGHFNWDNLHTTLYACSLFATNRLIELNLKNSTMPKSAISLLQHYCEMPAAETILLIETNKLDDKITKTSWYKTIEQQGTVVTIWPLPPEQLARWLINRAKQSYELTVLPDAAHLLASYHEGNLLALTQTLEKLALLFPGQLIDDQAVQTILADESRYTIFDFIDQLLLGDAKRTLHLLTHLQQDDVEPVLILWGITRELRLMSELANKLATGSTYDKLYQQYRIFPRRQSAVRRFLSTFSVQDCSATLKQTAKLDRIIKGAEGGDIWQYFRLFCLTLSSAEAAACFRNLV